jgi:glutamine amidotransferase
MKLVIFPIQGGNVQSLVRAFERIGQVAQVAQSVDELNEATHVIIPGIGSFEKAMEVLEQNAWKDPLIAKISDPQTYTLGICLGMQLFLSSSEETSKKGTVVRGLNQFHGRVQRLVTDRPNRIKIPHNGWNTLVKIDAHPLLKGIDSEDFFFFLHAYACRNVPTNCVLAQTDYDGLFPAVIGSGNCFGVQFHPEKSHRAGLKILQNFIELS